MLFMCTILATILSTSPGPNWWGTEHEMTPTVGAVPTLGDTIHVEKVDPGPVSIRDVRYILLNETFEPVSGIQGDLVDLLNADLEQNSTFFSYRDNDRDENISVGDFIIIKRMSHEGTSVWDCTFLLIYIPTGEKMNGGGTRLG